MQQMGLKAAYTQLKEAEWTGNRSEENIETEAGRDKRVIVCKLHLDLKKETLKNFIGRIK